MNPDSFDNDLKDKYYGGRKKSMFGTYSTDWYDGQREMFEAMNEQNKRDVKTNIPPLFISPLKPVPKDDDDKWPLFYTTLRRGRKDDD